MGVFGRCVAAGLVVVAFVAAPAGATPRTAKSPRHVVYQQSGTRSSTTKPFVVPREWTLAWSFDCAKSPLGEGSFVVTVHPASGNRVGASEGQKVDEFGPSGSGRQAYDSAGRKSLVIVALCPWKLKVLRGTS
jgi:hypothetical protein